MEQARAGEEAARAAVPEIARAFAQARVGKVAARASADAARSAAEAARAAQPQIEAAVRAAMDNAQPQIDRAIAEARAKFANAKFDVNVRESVDNDGKRVEVHVVTRPHTEVHEHSMVVEPPETPDNE
jgi:hypothetical protein